MCEGVVPGGGDTDVVSFTDERSKSKSLRSRPVNILALSDSLDTVLKNTLQDDDELPPRNRGLPQT